jgi:hypothetical protein
MFNNHQLDRAVSTRFDVKPAIRVDARGGLRPPVPTDLRRRIEFSCGRHIFARSPGTFTRKLVDEGFSATLESGVG